MGLEDVSKYPALFAALLGTGTWSLDDLKKVAGLNFLRVFREVEKVGPFFVKSILSKIVKPCPSAFFYQTKYKCGIMSVCLLFKIFPFENKYIF